MKLTYRQIEPFVQSPDPSARVVLIYGPDDGLVRERAALIGKSVIEDLNDPFNAVSLTADQIAEDPARLADEASAMSMMGGARLIKIDQASDKLAVTLKDYLQDPSADNLVLICAGELGPRSPLRQLVEKAKNAAALPCYVEGERDIAGLIRQSLQDANYTIQPDALTWLAANITGDRQRARSEIDKLILYMGPYEGQGRGTVTLEDVQAACGEAGAGSLDDLVYAVAGARGQDAMTGFTKLLQEGVPVIAILRALQNHFRRLHFTRAGMAQGASIEEAMKSLQPPIFFKLEQPFKAQIQRWSPARLQSVMAKLADLEAQTKKTGTPVETLCAQAILSISAR